MSTNNNFMGMDGFVWFIGVVEDRDDPSKIGRYINGIKIISFGEFEDRLSKNSLKIKKLIFCIPSIESFKADKIKKKVIDQGIKFITKIDQSSEDGILNILNDISIK